MSEIGAADFKAHCLQVMDKVRQTRRPVTITKRGVPVARLVPVDPPGEFALGALASGFKSAGDIVTSPLSDAEWTALEAKEAERSARWVQERAPRKRRTRRRTSR